MKLNPGDKAPDFALYDTTKTKVSLADHKGKNVVLLFFPQAFTRVCTKELCSVRDNLNLYNQLHATVFGISVDSLYTLAKYKQDEQLTPASNQIIHSLKRHWPHWIKNALKNSFYPI